ncbi:MAG: UDP-N-acetylmuramoyl-tripeptide--D-alanyl-D-alanine ligase [Lachnospiraceae bacterium]
MMKKMTCGEIAKACNGTFYGTEREKERVIAGIALDSRKIEKDWVFVATVGEKVDGHSFIPQVFEKQAACVVCEKMPEQPTGPFIFVESTFQALKDIAAYYRSILDVKVVGITGSVGKTSTKEMIAAVLETGYRVQKTAGNFNNEVGLPLTVFSVGEEHDIAVLEMGISDFGEMHRLGKIAKPDIMVITNIGQCHLENLKTRDGILQAKTEVFDEMDASSEVVLNGDDDKLATINAVHGKAPHFFSRAVTTDGKAGGMVPEVYGTDVENLGLHGSSFVLHIGKESVKVHIPIPGEHMVLNALAAATVGHLLGLTSEEIAKGISGVEAVGGRGHIVDTKLYTLIDDCYNANPVSMKAAIDLLATANTRKAAIMGDMFELGNNEKSFHKEVGAYAAGAGIDVIICIGELAGYMAEGAKEAGAGEVYHFADQAAFLSHAEKILHPGDAILLKASHGMHFENLLEALQKLR